LLEQLIVDLEEGVGYLLLHPTSTPCERRFLEEFVSFYLVIGEKIKIKHSTLNSS
jgi:hypothetical protein